MSEPIFVSSREYNYLRECPPNNTRRQTDTSNLMSPWQDNRHWIDGLWDVYIFLPHFATGGDAFLLRNDICILDRSRVKGIRFYMERALELSFFNPLFVFCCFSFLSSYLFVLFSFWYCYMEPLMTHCYYLSPCFNVLHKYQKHFWKRQS